MADIDTCTLEDDATEGEAIPWTEGSVAEPEQAQEFQEEDE